MHNDTDYGASAALNNGLRGPSQIGDAVPPQPAISAAEASMSKAVDLADRVQALVNRLIGSVPTLNGPSEPADKPYSLFDGLSKSARRSDDMIRQAMAALDRLESSLP